MDLKTYTLLQITVFLAFLLGVRALDNQKLALEINKEISLKQLERTNFVKYRETPANCWGTNCRILGSRSCK